MFVKICGITRGEDAEAAIEQGANALGFIFWPDSPRYIDPARAREIVATLPASVTAVGVFVNQPAEHVNQVAGAARLGAVQLHGEEDERFVAGMTVPVIKAVTADSDASARPWPDEVLLLVDAADPVRRGGTGRTADWSSAAALAKRRRVILAGGLTPENIADAVARVQPFGVDVSSGVERSPGIKDRQRLVALFDAIKEGRETR
jgi:phosphoribosylanthranilate isomerase